MREENVPAMQSAHVEVPADECKLCVQGQYLYLIEATSRVGMEPLIQGNNIHELSEYVLLLMM
jgi:PP-loop superfamily ATP-utilizing enzyme